MGALKESFSIRTPKGIQSVTSVDIEWIRVFESIRDLGLKLRQET